uniref:Uncharacterized protein n=1 Tax=Chromera velia CCMP2878 TaxID=1169474 RepID=A0A0G4I245_9ALVE|eukprot:Cvel_10241.t1-p1 / transcript=Cvel_10241.t1 / gene=Cvel_10241 / organism=Chromera_velia_CCMP2878 / gene_product=hypothetical protein / transcript_product=hypothetical protein / location=Cvel_scaffold613:55449-61316(-) / protein_length=845 / sequence_SO=supercontig / SO=protein_coding / is_pseudo=false
MLFAFSVQQHYVLFALSVCFALPFSVNAQYPNCIPDGNLDCSVGLYRIPFEDNVPVTANNDHTNHPPPSTAPNDAVDLGSDTDSRRIVAAASGIIRGIVDVHGNCDGGCTGDNADAGGVPYSANNPGGWVGGDYNNYVWLEHFNGEWTKYSHFDRLSVTNLGWQVGDTVFVGEILGIEGTAGASGGPHLHFEVAVPDDDGDPPFTALGGFINGGFMNRRITKVCPSPGFTPNDDGDGLYTDGEMYTSGPCTNTGPSAVAGGPYQVNEGSIIDLDGLGSSDPENAILNFLWTFTSDPTGIAALFDDTTGTPRILGVNEGNLVIQVTVDDKGGDVVVPLYDSDTAAVTVLNVAPSVEAGSNVNVPEGSEVFLAATFEDPGTEDTHTATVNWGLGAGPEGVTVTPVNSVKDSRVFCNDGVYVVKVAVDDGVDMGMDTLTVTVQNVPPTVTAFLTSDVIEEGGMATVRAVLSDPGEACEAYTAIVNWGDGRQQNVAVADLLGDGISIDFCEDGDYTVTVTINDGAASGMGSADLSVTPVAPLVTAAPLSQSEHEGSPVTISASFSDPASACETFTSTVDWGDGDGPMAVNIGDLTNGGVSKTFCEDGLYEGEVTVSDDDGTTGSAPFVFAVLPVAPTVSASPTLQEIAATKEEPAVALIRAVVEDPARACEEYTVVVDWGDGSPEETVGLSEIEGEPGVTHEYGYEKIEWLLTVKKSDAFVVRVTVIENDDGLSGFDEVTVKVDKAKHGKFPTIPDSFVEQKTEEAATVEEKAKEGGGGLLGGMNFPFQGLKVLDGMKKMPSLGGEEGLKLDFPFKDMGGDGLKGASAALSGDSDLLKNALGEALQPFN